MKKNIARLMLIVISIFFLAESVRFPSYSEEKDWKEYKTSYESNWKFLKEIKTVAPIFYRIKDYVVLPNPKDKNGFLAEPAGKSIKLDLNGDGKIDKTLTEKENIVEYKYSIDNLPYAMRIWRVDTEGNSYWCYQRACFRKAQVEGENIILIDDNNNGKYEYGIDALLVGQQDKDKQASLLSKIIVIKGKLYEFKTDELGTTISLREYKGPTGKINILKELNFKLKPTMVMLSSTNGEITLNIPLKAETATLPIGEYNLQLAIFNDQLRARKGELPPIKVEEGKVSFLKWGGPFKLYIEPICEKGGELVWITPPALWTAPKYNTQKLDCPFIKMTSPTVRGANGEEYFAPDELKGPSDYFVFPDLGVKSFEVEIIALEDFKSEKGEYRKGKVLNKIGYPLVDSWRQVDLSGLVEKVKPYWDYMYQCPLYEYRGKVLVKVWTHSVLFGGKISFEKEIEVKD